MSRIAVFIPDLHGGGTERMMVRLVNAFAARNHETELILATRAGPYLDKVSDRVTIIDLQCSFMSPRIVHRLSRHLARSSPDALLSAMTYPNVAALLARRIAGLSMRVVISERTVLTVQSRQCSSLKEKLKPLAARMTYHMADHVISVADDVSTDLVEHIGVDPGRITTINNPVIPDNGMQPRAAPEHPWFHDKTAPVVLSVGRLVQPKDYPTLLTAIARLPDNCPARLLILGEGPDRTALEALAGDLGIRDRVAMPGFAGDPYAWMQHADLFVLSSVWEGSPNALVEAMGCGCPVVSTDCPGGSRRILEDGRHGRLVSVGDADGLAQAITDTLKNPPDRQQLLARAADFTVSRSADRYLAVLCP
jgi:glycosyltransferase involved in cell wall biosynthesis